MAQALDCAREAMAADEVPIGAVVVDEQVRSSRVLPTPVEHDWSQGSHAEMKALEPAGCIEELAP